MRIIIGESSYNKMYNIGNEIVLKKEIGTTFVPESDEDENKIRDIVKQLLGITNKEDG